MNVSKLIKILSNMPQDAIVASDGRLTWFGKPKILTDKEISSIIYLSKDKKYLYISEENIDY